MAWQALLSAAGKSGGQQSNKYINTPVDVNSVGLDLSQFFQGGQRAPGEITVPGLSTVTKDQALSNKTLLIVLGAGLVFILLRKRGR